MAVVAAIAGVAVAAVGTTHAIETSAQGRRLAGQAKNRQDVALRNAETSRQLGIEKEENNAFNKIKRQRARGVAATAAGGAPATTMMTGGSSALAAPPAGAGIYKNTLGS